MHVADEAATLDVLTGGSYIFGRLGGQGCRSGRC
jgi:hypothetical protein